LTHFIGWVIKGNSTFSKLKIKKAILIAAPHTHWIDLFLGILIRGSVGFKSSFIAKKELFFFPLSIFLKLIGGIPVNRSKKNNTVNEIATMFNQKKEFMLSLAPEGTRQKVSKFKTGFYYIAKEARIPIIMITMDYSNKQSVISDPFYPTKNFKDDLNFIESFFDGVDGKVKKYSFTKS
jgi:1-acyl-sn-glycerol-3-phosphate acyltransferase